MSETPDNAPDAMTFTPALYKKLVKRYAEAVEHNEEQFDFYGHVLLTGYAKYLCEYLKTKFTGAKSK